MKKIVIALALVFSLLCLNLAVLAEGAGPIELNKKGSLTITLKTPEGEISGGTVELYSVADIYWDGEKYAFAYKGDFADCTVDIETVTLGDSASKLAKYAQSKGLTGIEAEAKEGKVVFADIPVGLYLVVQTEATEGFSKTAPFVITIPANGKDNLWNYNVDASPKVEIYQESITPPPDIPQTGKLQWPVPILTISGLFFVALGAILCAKKGREE